MAATLILGFPNHADATYYTVGLSGGSWVAGLPLTNLRDERLAKVARSTDDALASTKFVIDMGVSRPILLFCIPRCNISRDGLIRIRGSESADGITAAVYDTGWVDVWTRIYVFGSLPWGHPSFWDGKLAAEDAAYYDVAFIHVAATEQTARYWSWEIDDTTNADTYVELSRLFMAPGWQPTINMQYGATFGVETDTTAEKSLGGVEYYDRQAPRRTAKFVVGNLDEDEALANAFEMQRTLGIDRQLYLVWDSDDTDNLHRRSILATMRSLTPLEFPYFDAATAAFQLQEVL